MTQVLGWLAPDGVLHPCHYEDHDGLADQLGLGSIALERAGWCRLTEVDVGGLRNVHMVADALFGRGKQPTEAQAEFLLSWEEE